MGQEPVKESWIESIKTEHGLWESVHGPDCDYDARVYHFESDFGIEMRGRFNRHELKDLVEYMERIHG